VELYDERFTTKLAERDGGKAAEDSRAAAYLLEGWLHAHAQVGDPQANV
jgi:RNase H-fold protein (predicted Holliday junction resolvase)